MEHDIISNMQKGLWVGQSMISPEGFTPFDTPPAPTNISLSSFKENSSVITIDGHEIKSISTSDSSSSKTSMAFLTSIDALIGFIKNFCFAILFFAKDSSFLYSRWKQGTTIIKNHSVALKALEVMI